MCGIVGVGDYSLMGLGMKEKGVFCELLVADALRGPHGTGIVKITKDWKSDWRKLVGNPYGLLNSKDLSEKDGFLSTNNLNFLIGHNRFASKGKVTTSNAHPFTHDHITLIHNGTVEIYSGLPELKDFEVDSEALCKSISKRGIQETLNMMHGPFAIVFFDDKAKTLNLIRNNGRPLFLGINDSSNRVVFASEIEMLHWICHRNFWDFKFQPIAENHLVSFSKGQLVPKITEMIPVRKWNSLGTGWTNGSFWDKTAGKIREFTGGTKVVNITSGKKKKTEDASFERLDRIKDYHIGDIVCFDLYNHEETSKNSDVFVLEGGIENQTFDVQIRVKGEKAKDILFEADQCRGKIQNIVKKSVTTLNETYISVTVYCSDPEPVFVKKKMELPEVKPFRQEFIPATSFGVSPGGSPSPFFSTSGLTKEDLEETKKLILAAGLEIPEDFDYL